MTCSKSLRLLHVCAYDVGSLCLAEDWPTQLVNTYRAIIRYNSLTCGFIIITPYLFRRKLDPLGYNVISDPTYFICTNSPKHISPLTLLRRHNIVPTAKLAAYSFHGENWPRAYYSNRCRRVCILCRLVCILCRLVYVRERVIWCDLVPTTKKLPSQRS